MRVRRPSATVNEKDADTRGHSFTESNASSFTADGSLDRGLTSTFDHVTVKPAQRVGTESTLTNTGNGDDDFYDYSNGWFLASAAYIIWFAVLCANVFSLYQIGTGQA